MTYGRILLPSDLPPAGPPTDRSREKADLDFKSFADERQPWEHAKDIAAFANALGGVLLIGADDTSGDLLYPGLRGQTVAQVKSIYEGAAKMCSPTATVDVVPIEHPSGVVVVAVNVDPHVDQAMAAPAGTRDKNGKPCRHDTAWVFPVRRASLTEAVLPEALPVYMNREIRRTLLLLARIAPEARRKVTVHSHMRRPVQGGALVVDCVQSTMAVVEVSVERNRLRLVGLEMGSPQCNVPILDVMDVWESADGCWDIRISGEIHRVKGGQLGDRLSYVPLPR